MKTNVFIDGFNLYHGIDFLKEERLKWLNLRTLSQNILKSINAKTSAGLELGDIFYFTAYAEWKKHRVVRHTSYVKALRHVGVTTKLGRFGDSDRTCRICREDYVAKEEKKTDVNMALAIVLGAVRDDYDCALIITNDSDQVPAIEEVNAAGKTAIIVFPPSKDLGSFELRNIAKAWHPLDGDQIREARFEDHVPAPNKGKRAVCPPAWL